MVEALMKLFAGMFLSCLALSILSIVLTGVFFAWMGVGIVNGWDPGWVILVSLVCFAIVFML